MGEKILCMCFFLQETFSLAVLADGAFAQVSRTIKRAKRENVNNMETEFNCSTKRPPKEIVVEK